MTDNTLRETMRLHPELFAQPRAPEQTGSQIAGGVEKRRRAVCRNSLPGEFSLAKGPRWVAGPEGMGRGGMPERKAVFRLLRRGCRGAKT
jgi:hypothetical protein